MKEKLKWLKFRISFNWSGFLQHMLNSVSSRTLQLISLLFVYAGSYLWLFFYRTARYFLPKIKRRLSRLLRNNPARQMVCSQNGLFQETIWKVAARNCLEKQSKKTKTYLAGDWINHLFNTDDHRACHPVWGFWFRYFLFYFADDILLCHVWLTTSCLLFSRPFPANLSHINLVSTALILEFSPDHQLLHFSPVSPCPRLFRLRSSPVISSLFVDLSVCVPMSPVSSCVPDLFLVIFCSFFLKLFFAFLLSLDFASDISTFMLAACGSNFELWNWTFSVIFLNLTVYFSGQIPANLQPYADGLVIVSLESWDADKRPIKLFRYEHALMSQANFNQ